MKKEKIYISGMSCPHCAMAVERELKQVDNLTLLDVQVGHAEIEYDETKVDFSVIENAVKEAGYEIKERELV